MNLRRSLLLLALLLSAPALAQTRPPPARPAPAAPPLARGAVPAADAPGARDGSLARYAGSILLEAKGGAFDEIKLPNAKLVRAGTERDGRNNDLYLLPNPLKLEGRLTRLTYLIPEGRSPLEVIRGYQQLVRDGGGAVPWECAGAECGGSPATRATQGGSETGVIHMLYPYDLVAGNWTMCPLDENRAAQRYTLLDLPNGGGKAAVLSWTIGDVSAGSDCKAWVGRTVALAETAARGQRMEVVQAAALGQGLQRDGRVALYAILFDTNRAEVKLDSAPQLAELVAFLRKDPALRALVVGHTDNQGGLDPNVDLSRRRAQAVVAALVAAGIPASRLVAQGVGMAAPVSTNATEEGRTRNRRVELVQQ